MTESIESAEPADDSEPVLDMAAMRKVRKEAAELRKRNLELEEQLGAATARETAHQRDVVAAAAQSAGMIDPSDFLAVHPDPAEFLDEQFRTVIGDRVAEATAALLEQKPHLGRTVGPPPSNRPIEKLRTGARAPEDKPQPASWYGAWHGSGA